MEADARRRRAAIEAALLARIDFSQPGAVDAAVRHYLQDGEATLREDADLVRAVASIGAEVDARVLGADDDAPSGLAPHPRFGLRRFDPAYAAMAVARRAAEHEEADAAHAAAAAAARAASNRTESESESGRGRSRDTPRGCAPYELPPPGRRGTYTVPGSSARRDGDSTGNAESVAEFCAPLAPSRPFVLSVGSHSRGAVLERVEELSAAVEAQAALQISPTLSGTVAPLHDRVRAAESAISARIARADQSGEAVGVAFAALRALVESLVARHGSGNNESSEAEDSFGPLLPSPTDDGLWTVSRQAAERAALAELDIRERAAAARAAVLASSNVAATGADSMRIEVAAAVSAEVRRRQGAAEQAVIDRESAERAKEQVEAQVTRLGELRVLAEADTLRARGEAAQSAELAVASASRLAASREAALRAAADLRVLHAGNGHTSASSGGDKGLHGPSR